MFDYILLETTGLADPGNIAPLFWVDDGLGSSIYLDGIVTLIDARNILKSLDEPLQEAQHEDGHGGPLHSTAHLQISHADVLVLNKADLVTAAELEQVKQRVQAINGLAKVHVTEHARVPQLESFLLDLHSYDTVTELDIAHKGHSHLDPTISTITLEFPSLSEDALALLDSWLQSILWECILPESETIRDGAAFEIHRTKGRVTMQDGSVRLIQGVREVYEILEPDSKASVATGGSKLVLIGRGLDAEPWQSSLNAALKLVT